MNTLFDDDKEDQAKLVRANKYEQDRKKITREIYVSFRDEASVQDFASLLGIDITDQTRKLYFPINALYLDTQSPAIVREEKVSKRNEKWRKAWQGMPSFIQENNPPYKQIVIAIPNEGNVEAFSKLIGQSITEKTKSIWHPKLDRDENAKKRWVISTNTIELMPQYPIYIVSKGRSESRLTARSLERMRVPYYIVVEEQEYTAYKANTNSDFGTVLVLDNAYKMRYDVCDDLGLTKSTGPGPARNFAWDHSSSLGFEKHWVMDDNITDFYRLQQNQRIRVESGAMFRACEDFVGRYTNVPVSGLQYRFFIAPNSKYPPFVFNTRIYSCLLIDNLCEFKWRGRYNEDTDLSLRVMKAGQCTLQFNAFLQGKLATQSISGGNTDEFYGVEDQEDEILHGTSNKSDMQLRLHPDVSKNVWKYGRWHHYVDYSPFKNNKPILKDPSIKYTEIDDYGLEFINNWSETL